MTCRDCGGVVCKHNNTEYLEDKKVHVCLDCGKAFRKCEIFSRVVGYLRPTDGWNKGKKSEFEVRKEYKPVGHKDYKTLNTTTDVNYG